MKKIFYSLIFLPLLAACDQVDENDRYIEVAPIEVARKVLLEEFTGQNCVNCPVAHGIIEQLEEQYGDDLIVVSIHAGGTINAIPAPFGLMQEEGDEYAKRWDIEAYPAGVVDRTGSKMTMDQWAAAIHSDMGKDTDLDIDLDAQLSDDKKNIYITTELLSSQNIEGYLQLWVVENGIVTLQNNGGVTVPDYVHNNVFRGCVNGLWGQPVSLTANRQENFDNSIEVYVNETYQAANWNVDNLYIVGFVYDDSGVLQVNRVKVN